MLLQTCEAATQFIVRVFHRREPQAVMFFVRLSHNPTRAGGPGSAVTDRNGSK